MSFSVDKHYDPVSSLPSSYVYGPALTSAHRLYGCLLLYIFIDRTIVHFHPSFVPLSGFFIYLWFVPLPGLCDFFYICRLTLIIHAATLISRSGPFRHSVPRASSSLP